MKRLSVLVLTAAAVLAYPCWGPLQMHRDGPEQRRLREQYPYESIEARVPPVRPTTRPAALPAGATNRLIELEQAVQSRSNGTREEALRAMHEYSVREFLHSPGSGLDRMGRFGGRTLRSGATSASMTSCPSLASMSRPAGIPIRRETWRKYAPERKSTSPGCTAAACSTSSTRAASAW